MSGVNCWLLRLALLGGRLSSREAGLSRRNVANSWVQSEMAKGDAPLQLVPIGLTEGPGPGRGWRSYGDLTDATAIAAAATQTQQEAL